MSSQKKKRIPKAKGRNKSNIEYDVLDTAVTFDHNGKPTAGPDISLFPTPLNFSVLNLDLEVPTDLLQNMKDCIGLHRFWTYINTGKRFKSPDGSMSWQVPKGETYLQYVKYRNNWICLVEIASQSWMKGVITKQQVAEFYDSDQDKRATNITTALPKIILNSNGNHKNDVQETKLGPRSLMKSFDSVYNHVIDEGGECGDLTEAFTIFIVHLWDTVRNDNVKNLVLASFDPSTVYASRCLGSEPVGLMKKWQRCSVRAIKSIEDKVPYEIQHNTTPRSASELFQVVRVLYREDQNKESFNQNSTPIKLNGVDELKYGDQQGDPDPEGDKRDSGSKLPTPKYPNWILDSCSEPNEQQQNGHEQRSYAWANKMTSTAGTENIYDGWKIKGEHPSCTTGGLVTEEKTENTNYVSRISYVPAAEDPSLLPGHAKPFDVSQGTWVRTKRGNYEGALAQDITADDCQKRAVMKLIPKVDLQAISERNGSATSLQEAAVAAPGLISSQELEFFEPHIEMRCDRQMGDAFKVPDGLMVKEVIPYKRVTLSSLTYWGIQPTETSPRDRSSAANDVDWASSIFGHKERILPGEQDMKESREKWSKMPNIKAKRGDNSSVLCLVLWEV